MIDLQEQRQFLDARVQVAIELLTKAQSGLTLEWRDPAARATLLFIERYAIVARGELESFVREVQKLYVAVAQGENDAEGPERLAS